MIENETMEDVAMNGEKIEQAERKRLRRLEKIKRGLKLDDAWNEDPIEAMELVDTFVGIVEALKDPLVKSLLGKSYKTVVNAMIDASNGAKSVAKVESADILTKIK